MACKVGAEKATDNLIGYSSVHSKLFSSFNMLSLALTFDILIIMCLDVGFFGFLLFGAG